MVEVIGVVSTMEHEKARAHIVNKQLCNALSCAGFNFEGGALIRKLDFQKMLLNPVVVKTLRGVDVDPVGLIDFLDHIFGSEGKDDHGITLDKLVMMVCELGGSNKATVKDIIDMRHCVIRQLAQIAGTLEKHNACFNDVVLQSPRYEGRLKL